MPGLYWNANGNIVWKTELPGAGHASPIVFGDHVFILAAKLETQERLLLRVDRGKGNVRWQRIVLSAPLEKKHSLNSFASSTPASDGEFVCVAFLDRDHMFLAAYDLKGRQRWAAHPGAFASKHGFCSSPILYRDMVILNGDHDGDSYLVALSPEHREHQVWFSPGDLVVAVAVRRGDRHFIDTR